MKPHTIHCKQKESTSGTGIRLAFSILPSFQAGVLTSYLLWGKWKGGGGGLVGDCQVSTLCISTLSIFKKSKKKLTSAFEQKYIILCILSVLLHFDLKQNFSKTSTKTDLVHPPPQTLPQHLRCCTQWH